MLAGFRSHWRSCLPAACRLAEAGFKPRPLASFPLLDLEGRAQSAPDARPLGSPQPPVALGAAPLALDVKPAEPMVSGTAQQNLLLPPARQQQQQQQQQQQSLETAPAGAAALASNFMAALEGLDSPGALQLAVQLATGNPRLQALAAAIPPASGDPTAPATLLRWMHTLQPVYADRTFKFEDWIEQNLS